MSLRVVIFMLCVSAATTSLWAFDDIEVTPKNQKKLRLDFKLTAHKYQQTWMVDFVVPAGSKLQAITRIGAFSPLDDFSSPGGLSVPFAGLTRFPRDNPSKPKEVQWVQGVRFWVGNAILSETQMQFDFRGQTYSIRLRDYATP